MNHGSRMRTTEDTENTEGMGQGRISVAPRLGASSDFKRLLGVATKMRLLARSPESAEKKTSRPMATAPLSSASVSSVFSVVYPHFESAFVNNWCNPELSSPFHEIRH